MSRPRRRPKPTFETIDMGGDWLTPLLIGLYLGALFGGLFI